MGPDRTTGMLAGPWLAQPVIIDVPGSLNTYVYSANWQHVAGTYEDANGASHGFIGMPNALATFDAPVPGLFNTWTYALNNAGAHVGLYETENLYAGYLAYQQHFWRFVVPGSTFTVPLDINDHWEIVGLYTMGGIVKSFVWSEGIFYEFRAPGWPEVETLVHSFNTPGQFAGYVITDADTFTARGFLATRLPETPGAAMMAKTARTQTAQPQRMASARSTLCQANGQRYSSKLQAVMTQLCR
jgi:hypothetical protein